ncbi:MAG: hypothetical protein RBJ76_03215 [Stenomitos frigidus ULC029]
MAAPKPSKNKPKSIRDRLTIDITGIRDRIEKLGEHQEFAFLREMKLNGKIRYLLSRILDILEGEITSKPIETPAQPDSIQAVINENLAQFGTNRTAQIEAMAQAAYLEPDELQRILNNEKPTTEQLIALSSVLQKGVEPWDIEVLKEIVYIQYGCCKKEDKNHV